MWKYPPPVQKADLCSAVNDIHCTVQVDEANVPEQSQTRSKKLYNKMPSEYMYYLTHAIMVQLPFMMNIIRGAPTWIHPYTLPTYVPIII